MWKCGIVLLMFSVASTNSLYNFIDLLESVLEIPPEEPELLPRYDFIVVGAGSAGCVVANRLTENPNWNVLLIEAGTDDNPMINIPLTVGNLQISSINWNYTSESGSNYCTGMNDGRCKLPRGRVMGGSSALNFMIYTRGSAEDYNEWNDLGNRGWSARDVFPYFKKIENITIDRLKDSYYHSTKGYMNVGYPTAKTLFADIAIRANEEFGMSYVDYNGPNQIGISRIQGNLKNGLRHSSNGAYIIPFQRPNLHVKKLAMVKKILFNYKKQAYGVEFVSGGKTAVVKAKKEIVISAGAFNSPQLLMLSGIGPKKHLKQHNIKVVADLPVGKNLMDHIAVPLVYTIDKSVDLWGSEETDMLGFMQNGGDSILSIPGACETIGFYNLEEPQNATAVPDIELMFISTSVAENYLLPKNLNIKESLHETMFKPILDEKSVMVYPLLLSPKSKGEVKLASADYRDYPLIYPNYLDHPDDIKTLVAGIRLMLNISQQPAFQEIGAKFYAIPLDECPYEFTSDEYLECMSRILTMTIYHYSGTCKMGPKRDATSVVDDRLRVHGVKNLRVIDASVMPKIVRGHTHAPTVMIGEKGADLIKKEWGLK